MQLREIMTSSVVTAGADADVLSVAQLMRDRAIGSVVICDAEGEPAAMVTDRDLTVRALADERSPNEPVADHCSRPLVTGEPDMDLEEAAALMVRHRIRRLPVVESGASLSGDHYRMLAYCTSLRVPTAWLVYPGAGEIKLRRILNTDIDVVEFPLDLSRPPSEILASVADLAHQSWGEVVRQATISR